MSKAEDKNTNPAPEAPVKPPKAIIKVVEIPLGEEYQEPEGWILKEIHSVDVAEGKFFGVLVKILDYPSPKLRKGKEYDIPVEE